MTALLNSLGLTDTAENQIYVNSAVEWLNTRTILDVELADYANWQSSVKLFILKYAQLMSTRTGVASESISGLSQSFVTGQSLEASIYELTVGILGKDVLKSTATVFSGEDGWDYGC